MSKAIASNRVCWVKNCNKEIKEWPYCEKHLKAKEVKLKVPAYVGDNPNIPK